MHAAQVLLTSFDLSVRMHYLERPPGRCAGCSQWRCGAGRQRERHHRHRRDHLRRQRLPLRPAGAAARRAAARPAHRHRRPAHRRSRARSGGASWSRRSTTSPSSTRYRDRRPHLAVRLGRHAQQGGGGRDGERRRDPGGDLLRAPCRVRCSRRREASRSVRASPPIRERTPSFKLWLRYAKPARGRVAVDDGAARVLREQRLEPAAGRDHRVDGEFAAGDAVDVVCDGDAGRQGDRQLLRRGAGRIKGMKSAEVRGAAFPRRPKRRSIATASCSHEPGGPGAVGGRCAASSPLRRSAVGRARRAAMPAPREPSPATAPPAMDGGADGRRARPLELLRAGGELELAPAARGHPFPTSAARIADPSVLSELDQRQAVRPDPTGSGDYSCSATVVDTRGDGTIFTAGTASTSRHRAVRDEAAVRARLHRRQRAATGAVAGRARADHPRVGAARRTRTSTTRRSSCAKLTDGPRSRRSSAGGRVKAKTPRDGRLRRLGYPVESRRRPGAVGLLLRVRGQGSAAVSRRPAADRDRLRHDGRRQRRRLGERERPAGLGDELRLPQAPELVFGPYLTQQGDASSSARIGH